MNDSALIRGRSYHFLKQIASLEGGEPWILCADASGETFVCSEALWLSSFPGEEQVAPVYAQSPAREKIAFFLSLFRGREGLYAKRYYSASSGKSGYTPACRN